MEDRGLRPLKIWVCGGVERRGDPFTLCLLFPLYGRGRMYAARARLPHDNVFWLATAFPLLCRAGVHARRNPPRNNVFWL